LVGFRMVLVKGAEPMSVEGLFHLVDRDGYWKIEDLYFTSVNRQELERWIIFSRDYQQFAAAPSTSKPAAKSSGATQPNQLNLQKALMSSRGAGVLALKALGTTKIGKIVGGILLLILVGAGRLLFGSSPSQPKPEPAPAKAASAASASSDS